MRLGTAALVALALALALPAGACQDTSGINQALITTDTLTLAAPTADSAVTPSAIDVASVSHARFPERSSDALLWDVALRKTGGALYFRPYPGSGTQIGAGINGPTSEDFAKLTTAPSRSNYGDSTVVVQEGKTYTVRSRQVAELGTVCVHYAKLSPLVANAAAGTVRIVLVSSAQCSDRRLTDN